MMTERNKKLVRSFGMPFWGRSHIILEDFLYLPADAASCLTEEEWKDCAEAMEHFSEELRKAQKIVVEKMTEAGIDDKEFLEMYKKWKKNYKEWL